MRDGLAGHEAVGNDAASRSRSVEMPSCLAGPAAGSIAARK
jgi:hypothetical protein